MFVVIDGRVVETVEVVALDRETLVRDIELAQARLNEYDATAAAAGVEITMSGTPVETPVENTPPATVVMESAPVDAAPVEPVPVEAPVAVPVEQPGVIPTESAVAAEPVEIPVEQPAMIIQ